MNFLGFLSSLPNLRYAYSFPFHQKSKQPVCYNNLLVFRNGALKNFNLISLYVTHAEKFPLDKLEAANRTLKR